MRPMLLRANVFALAISMILALPALAGRPGETLDRLFADGPAQLAPSGVLYDRALPLSHIHELDGRRDAPAVSTARWRQVLHELRRASDDPTLLPPPAAFRGRGATRGIGTIPIAVIDYRYDRLHEAALEDARARVSSGPLQLDRSALVEARVFTAAAMVETSYRGERVEFVLPPELRFSNVEPVAQTLALDADDGRGFRAVSSDGGAIAHYDRVGLKTLRLRATDPDGREREAAFKLRVQALAAPAPDDTLQLTASISHESQSASGEAYVYLADGHASVTQPIVLIEGFDLNDNFNWDEIYALLNEANLLEDVRAAGYDIVALNFDDATDDMQRNSYLVVELLQQIQQLIDPRAHYTLAGASMGGVCSRFALAYMEQNALEHRVNTFISFDAPQRGANIPLGLQYWLDFFKDDSEDAAFLLSRLDRPAARQLLVYHHRTPPSAIGEPDPLRASFMSELAGLGGYPTQPRLVAIANGSSTQQDQGFLPGEQILQWEFDNFFIDVRGNVWAVPDGNSQMILEALLDPIILPAVIGDVTVSGTDPFDNAPGGYRGSMAQADSTAAPFGDIIALHDDHCFIPTISALDLNTSDLFFDVAGELDLAAMSPFDALYFPVANQEHVAVTPENAVWFKNEVFSSSTAAGPAPLGYRAAVLRQNVPNPFNPATSIHFELFEAGHVTLEVFDARGARVVGLLNGPLPVGPHFVPWNGQDELGRDVGSGVYYYRLRSDRETDSRGMVLLR